MFIASAFKMRVRALYKVLDVFSRKRYKNGNNWKRKKPGPV